MTKLSKYPLSLWESRQKSKNCKFNLYFVRLECYDILKTMILNKKWINKFKFLEKILLLATSSYNLDI